MSTTWPIWLLALLLPAFCFLSMNMCIWTAPRWLGPVADALLWLQAIVVGPFLIALPMAIYFLATALICQNIDGKLAERISTALACLCFLGLTSLAMRLAGALRHQAFVRAARIGDSLVQALRQYRHDHGEYPDSLEQLIPHDLQEIPYTGMIAYPHFLYGKDRNDIQIHVGSYELRIQCQSTGLNFDRFIHWPAEVYPDRIQDKPVERILTWAYVHE